MGVGALLVGRQLHEVAVLLARPADGPLEEVAPDAEEGVSYGMPAFLYGGRPLLGFRAAKKHLSVFPFSPAAVEAVEDRLGGFDRSKGTIRFSPESRLPEDVLADLVRARKQEITKAR